MRREYIRDLLAGFIIGVIFFFGSGISNTHSGWLGWDFLSRVLPNSIVVYVLGWWIGPFLIYTITPLYKKRDGYTNIGSKVLSFIVYSVGICVSFIVVLFMVLLAFHNSQLVW